jgi:hypothetical protein
LLLEMLSAAAARPAFADAMTSCAAALTEATDIRDAAGRWVAEARALNSRKARVAGTPKEAGWKDEVQAHGAKYGEIYGRIRDLNAAMATLRQAGPCPENADIVAAIGKATGFLSIDVHAKRPPLPDGMCPSSPDLSAPLVPCPAR